MELFDDRVVLFESDEGGEYLLVTCEPSGMGGGGSTQTSRGSAVDTMVLWRSRRMWSRPL